MDYNPDPIYYQNIIPTQLDLSLVFLNNPPSNGNQWDMISLDFCFYDWLKKHPWKKTLLNESTPGMFDWWVKHPVNWVLMRYYLGNHSMHDDHDDVLWDSHPPYDFILGKSIENPPEKSENFWWIPRSKPSISASARWLWWLQRPTVRHRDPTAPAAQSRTSIFRRFFGTQKED